MRDLFIDIARVDSEVLDLWPKISRLAKEIFVVDEVQRPARLAAVVSIDACLERVTDLKQLPIVLPEFPRQNS